MPSSNGVGDARSLARLYASCVGEVDGIRTLSAEPWSGRRVSGAGQGRGADDRELFRLGFMLGPSFGAANPAKRSATRARVVRSRLPIPTGASGSDT
jgi:hypothetical protein